MKVEPRLVESQVSAHHGRIGPNAIIQTVQALNEHYGSATTSNILRRAGRADLLTALPATMIDEAEFYTLIQTLRSQLGMDESGRILQRSGQLTANYVMDNRIPPPVKLLLKLLPRRLALRLLLAAIKQHAWTFVGSGEFSYTLGKQPQLFIANCIESRDTQATAPVCHFYQGAFQELLRTLIDPQTKVTERMCRACGDERCAFAIAFC